MGVKLKSLYHCTPKKNVQSILSKGLSPSFSKSSLKAVFLAGSIDVAERYALMHRDHEEFVTFEVNVKSLSKKDLGPDNYELKDYLESMDSEDHWSELSWEESLKTVSQVAYYGVIDSRDLRIVSEINTKKQRRINGR